MSSRQRLASAQDEPSEEEPTTDERDRLAAEAAAARHGLRAHGLVDSPVTGGTGNREYLLWLAARTEGMMSAMDLRAAFDRIAAELRTCGCR